MTTGKDLFDILVTILPNDYHFKFNFVEQATNSGTQTNVTKNIVGIYFRDAGNPDVRDISTGEYKVNQYRVTFNIFTDRGEAGVIAGEDYCVRVCKVMDKLFNKQLFINNKDIMIEDCQKIGNYKKVGTTKQGIAVYSINYIIKYY